MAATTAPLPPLWTLAFVLTAGCPGDDSGISDSEGASSTGATGSEGSTTTSSTPATSTTTSGTTTEQASSTGADTTMGADTSGSDTSGSDTSGSDTSGERTSTGSESSSGGAMNPCDGMELLLYEQGMPGMPPGAPAGIGVGGFIRSADDFEVDAADQCWCVTRVVLNGFFSSSELSGDLEVGFHGDDMGVPLEPAIAVEAGAPIDTDGVLDYTLASPVVLPAATYWLAAMPEIPSIDEGIWFWLPSAVAAGSPWAMEASFPPFVPDCENWTSGADCFPINGTDLSFEIHGVVGGDACM